MIDLRKEKPFPLSEGPKTVGISYHSLYRLIHEGRESVTGEVIYLEKCRMISGIGTTREALERFNLRLNDQLHDANSCDKPLQ